MCWIAVLCGWEWKELCEVLVDACILKLRLLCLGQSRMVENVLSLIWDVCFTVLVQLARWTMHCAFVACCVQWLTFEASLPMKGGMDARALPI